MDFTPLPGPERYFVEFVKYDDNLYHAVKWVGADLFEVVPYPSYDDHFPYKEDWSKVEKSLAFYEVESKEELDKLTDFMAFAGVDYLVTDFNVFWSR